MNFSDKLTINCRGTFQFLALLLFSLMLLSNCVYAEELSGTIKIGGTGNALGAFGQLADAFRKIHPKVNFVILPSLGSGGGIKAVIDGAIDLGLSARQVKESEQQQGASSVPFARTPFVFVVSGMSDNVDLTLKDIENIYSGRTSAWPDGTPIRLILRPETDSDVAILKGMSPGMKDAVQSAMKREGMPVATSDQDNADALIKVPGSFGAATTGQIISEKRSLTIIKLDGIVPDTTSLANGTYPYSKPLFLVTGAKSIATGQFIEFASSKEGKAILSRNGFLTTAGK